MNPPEPTPDPTPSPGAPAAACSAPPSKPAQAARVLGLLVAPGVACFLIGLAGGDRGGVGIAMLILGISLLGSLVAGIVAGRRLAHRFAQDGTGTGPACVGYSILCILAAGAISFGGCFMGLISSASFR